MGSVAPLVEYRQGDVAEALKRIIDGRIERVLLVTPPDSEKEHFREDTARRLTHYWGDRLNLVDLGAVKAHRLYDLLALYERAVGLVTVVTVLLTR